MKLVYKFALSILMLQGCLVSAEEQDKRKASMLCVENIEPKQIICDYRYSPKVIVKQIKGYLNSNEIQLDGKLIKPFPSEKEVSSTLILVDVSDIRRSSTIQGSIVPALSKLLDKGKGHQSFGLAVFDSEVKVLAPIVAGSAAAKAVLPEVKAQGLATEFYKSILNSLDLLQKAEGQRKTLIVVSDGKAEDTQYNHSDVVKLAKSYGIVVLGVGYAERGSDAAYLQSLQRLAEETHGIYLDGKSPAHADELIAGLARIEAGGRVVIPASELHGEQAVRLKFSNDDKNHFSLSQNVLLTDGRPPLRKLTSSLATYWYIWLLSLTLSVSVFFVGRRVLRSKSESRAKNKPYGVLIELDSKGTHHPLRGSASRLGRGKENNLIFFNDTVSLNHAEIHRRRDGSIRINDLSSSNGVYVNDVKILETELNSGDVIELGEVRLRFERTED
jgi:hypothetical protein